KDNVVETVDIIATDDLGRTGTRSGVVINPGAGTTLTFVQQPSNATAGTTISPAVTVRVQDSLGNNLSGIAVTLTIGSGSGTLKGTTTIDIGSAAGNGVAAFSNLEIDAVGSKQLAASASGLTSTNSSFFTVGSGGATRLAIQTQPSITATAGVVFAQQPIIRVEDQFGNLATNDNSTVVLATRSDGSGTLQGRTNITGVGGVATFTNL